MSAVQQREQVFVHHMPTARDIDQVGAGPQLGQGGLIQQVFGLWGQRQQVHQHARSCQKLCKLRLPVQAAHPVQTAFGAAPAQHRKSKVLYRARHLFAQNAQTQNAHRKIHPIQHGRLLPQALLRLRLKKRKVARMAYQRVAHVFGHLHAHPGIVQAHDRQVGAHLAL